MSIERQVMFKNCLQAQETHEVAVKYMRLKTQELSLALFRAWLQLYFCFLPTPRLLLQDNTTKDIAIHWKTTVCQHMDYSFRPGLHSGMCPKHEVFEVIVEDNNNNIMKNDG